MKLLEEADKSLFIGSLNLQLKIHGDLALNRENDSNMIASVMPVKLVTLLDV